MKYKDYLILPVIVMFIIYASCAYVGNADSETGNAIVAPEASVDPAGISWMVDDADTGECWYEAGIRGGSYFAVNQRENGAKVISFHEGNKGSESAFVVSDMHMRCNNDGTRYDLIFTDEMTAYDTLSGRYFQRGDYSQLKNELLSGRFVNTENPKDYFLFKDNGKSTEYFGDKVFKGKWNFETSSSLSVYDKSCKQDYHFDICFDGFGGVCGLDFNGITYELVTT